MFRMSRFQALAASTVLLAAPVTVSAETRDFDLSEFNRIEISTGINAIVEIGGEFSVRAETDNTKILEDLRIEVRGRKLIADLDIGFLDSLLGKNRDVTVYITLPDLTEVEGNAGADVLVSGSYGPELVAAASSGASLLIDGLTSDRVELDASSGASLRVSGECVNLRVDASSGGSVNASKLTCEIVKADASSGGSATVFATTSINADASSGGGIDVEGAPTRIEVDESSGGDVDFNY